MQIAFHTGPTIVHQIADKMREAGVAVSCEGTEHVYIDAAPNVGELATDLRYQILAVLREKHGTDFGLR
jgi:hypothetical protein